MKSKVLITGASGFVGFHLTELAALSQFEVHAAVRKSSKVEDIEPFVDKFVYPNFESVADLKALLELHKYDYIIHAAALTRAKSEDELIKVNVGYSLNLLRAAFSAAINLKRFIFVGSLAAIGPIAFNASLPIDESNAYKPVTAYGRSKRQAEEAILAEFAHAPISIIRPTAVYGPKEKDLYVLFKTLNAGLDAYIGDNPQKLSFIYVKDLAQVILNACLLDNGPAQIYNITDGNSYGRYEMADIFQAVLAKKAFRIHLPLWLVKKVAQGFEFAYRNSANIPVLYPERLNELTAENWICNIDKAKERLNFKPNFDLKAGLSETLNWYKKNKWL
ncbi:NAD-dependent epimerase/dehydratase family protein [Sphingobacteriaceae bacterium WQ 2009]|uniref:NAD-dependent epimerase/dehydratase family protein n=1 Tax=Rhinopithecimicrobium faecis TaxID=2820698 RepID=A0A8T4H822_9SPHI|nr:NAD-dependent epimerase/dehydratase family protein [Sphingobacteriaceae bacterium WQ 2009]